MAIRLEGPGTVVQCAVGSGAVGFPAANAGLNILLDYVHFVEGNAGRTNVQTAFTDG